MNQKLGRTLLQGVLVLLTASVVRAQQGGPGDYDFKLIPEKKILREGEEVNVDAVVAVRKGGVLGWSYGVEHDEALLELISATTDGSQTPGVLADQHFNQTRIITENNVKVGWIQGIVLSLGLDRKELPIDPRFVMAKARYKVNSGVCAAQTQREIPTSIAFSKRLAVPGSPPVDVTLTVEADSVEPTVQEAAEVTIDCPPAGAVSMKLALQPQEDRPLIANKTDELSIRVLLRNESAAGSPAAQVEAWQYGLKLDPAVLSVVDLTTGTDAAAANGGTGPEFRAYNFNPLEQSSDGTVKGVTVGVVLSLDPPFDVLSVPAGEARNLEVLKVKSAIELAQGAPEQTTTLAFLSDVLGAPVRIENIIVVNGSEVVLPSDPAETPSLLLRLVGPGAVGSFKRGDANNDGRFDIADAVRTIRVLFYQDGTFVCQDAADANDDDRLDIADAIYIIDWQFRASQKPPAAPHPNCGTDPTSPDTLSCAESTRGC